MITHEEDDSETASSENRRCKCWIVPRFESSQLAVGEKSLPFQRQNNPFNHLILGANRIFLYPAFVKMYRMSAREKTFSVFQEKKVKIY